jgi:hypothetical protein
MQYWIHISMCVLCSIDKVTWTLNGEYKYCLSNNINKVVTFSLDLDLVIKREKKIQITRRGDAILKVQDLTSFSKWSLFLNKRIYFCTTLSIFSTKNREKAGNSYFLRIIKFSSPSVIYFWWGIKKRNKGLHKLIFTGGKYIFFYSFW